MSLVCVQFQLNKKEKLEEWDLKIPENNKQHGLSLI